MTLDYEITHRSHHGQNNDQTWLIKYEGRLFKVVNHVDTSYDFQSYGSLKVMGSDGKWEILSEIHPSLNNDSILKEITPLIKTYSEYLPKVEAVI